MGGWIVIAHSAPRPETRVTGVTRVTDGTGVVNGVLLAIVPEVRPMTRAQGKATLRKGGRT